ncbi:DNA internalization-related competence protein ComEC/Rec2 [Tuanshanicoccus lijuaniae]|uniref:DNA internalization-related competence protein ComEC/Rec2 n=1 Tax=Aerococcaceae bacterium zg-1292 TaxID=2774330 RepID=UPI001BD90E48|nr:DNA internalization-related competence protein ComEC/Rec2 [Aerococcaceae bacterium zg-A91]MBS4457949.1 DNA internalization-related competence protein ComEC/Rec2 [Aerococcaceae bacterium zg-BR33]
MKQLRHHIFFGAMAVYISCRLVLTGHWIWLVAAGYLLLRIYYFNRAVKRMILLLSIVSTGFAWYSLQIPHLPQESTIWSVVVDPNNIQVENNQFSGRGTLLVDGHQLPIDLIGWDWLEDQIDNQVMLWQVQGSITKPARARNFGVFDYRKYLASQGVHYQLTIEAVITKQSVQSISSKFSHWRYNIIAHFKRLNTSYLFSLYNKLFWNIQSPHYRQSKQYFIELGVIHLFALSGLHVTWLGKQLKYVLRRCGIWVEYVDGLVIVLLLVYSYITGFPIGVVRSVGMLLLAKLLPIQRLDRLSLLTIGLLLVKPYLALSMSFQLSFLISYLLILMPKNLPDWETSTICLLFSLPLTIGQSALWYPLQFVWSWFIGKWLMAILTPCVIGLTLLTFVPNGLAGVLWLEQLLQPLTSLVLLKQPVIVVGTLSVLWQVILWSSASFWVTQHPRRYLVTFITYVACCCLANISWVPQAIVLDVGQGDALLLPQMASHKAWLIDTGGRADWRREGMSGIDPNYADKTIIPALKALGIRSLEGVVITHADIDHIGNLPVLAQAIPIRQIIISEHTRGQPIWQEIARIIPKRTKVIVLSPGQPFVTATQFHRTINAPEIYTNTDKTNDASIVSSIRLGSHQLLNVGDISIDAEQKLLRQELQLQATLLKTGHHGSKSSTSSALLEQLHPQLALISAGENNRYGHPHQEVIERLAHHRIPYVSTHKYGAIRLSQWPFQQLKVEVALP